MATSRLEIYNGALLLVGERKITGLTVVEEGRYLLDEVWNGRGVEYCLSKGQWMFAMRAAQFTYDTSFTAPFGYTYRFTKPTDWMLTSAVCSDAYFNTPLTRYTDEAGFWFADIQDIYVKYVSNDTEYGFDYSLWPEPFTEYVKTYFASRICHKLPGGKEIVEKFHGPPGFPQRGQLHQALINAKNNAAMALPTSFPARGSWSTSRQGSGSRSDRGNPGSLTG